MKSLLHYTLELVRANNYSFRVTLCLLMVLFIAGRLLIFDSESIQGLVGFALIFQMAVLLSLYFSNRIFLRQSNSQIEEIKSRKREAVALNTRLLSLINAMTQVAVITTDSQGRILLFSSGAERLFGISRGEVLGKSYEEVLEAGNKPNNSPDAERSQVKGAQPNKPVSFLSIDCDDPNFFIEKKYHKKDGRAFFGELRCAQIIDTDSGKIEEIKVIVDVSERAALLRKVDEGNEFLKLLTQRIPNVLYQYQLLEEGNSYFTYCNPSLEQVLELKPEDVVGAKFSENPLFKLIHKDDIGFVIAATRDSMRTGGAWVGDFRVVLPTKGLRWLHAESYAEKRADETYVWYGSLIDITESKARESALQTQSITDELTGAYNRRHFMASLDKQVDLCRRYGSALSLIMLDVDKFKSINDRWGHECGDIVLKKTCQVIGKRLRTTDVLCRIGGEEFVIICPSTKLDQAAMLAESLRRLLENQLTEPVGQVTASFGVTYWQKNLDGEVLLRKVDEATYSAKEQGRNRVHIYESL
jgi:diguanylate cyclase (GGDEF)-like protein